MVFAKSVRKYAVPVVGALMLNACAGTNFVRPAEGTFILGKTTAAEVEAKLGEPRTTGATLKNDQNITQFSYAYAEAGGDTKYKGVTGGRHLEFAFFQDVMIEQKFTSSFAEDVSDFDETKVPEIKKGSSTRSDVIALLGKPSGGAIYPFVANKTDGALIYAYIQVSGSAFTLKVFMKTLVVSYDLASGVVTDVDYSETGAKPRPKDDDSDG